MTDKQVQNYRHITPMASVSNFFVSIGGFAIIGLFGWHLFTNMEISIQNLADKSDAHYSKIYNRIDAVSNNLSSFQIRSENRFTRLETKAGITSLE
jgi:hypothetical protein